MTNKRWAVTIHRADEAPSTHGYEGPDEQSAMKFVAVELELDVDDHGDVTGDPQITRITVEAAPDDMPVHLEEDEEQ